MNGKLANTESSTQKHSKRFILSNSVFFLKIIWKADKTIFIWLFIQALIILPASWFSVTIFKLLIDTVTLHKSFAAMLTVVIGYAMSSFLTSFIQSFMSDCRMKCASMKTEEMLSNMLLQKARIVDMSDLDDPNFHDQLSKAFSEASNRTEGFLSYISSLISQILQLAVCVSVVVMLNPLFLAVSALLCILIFIIQKDFVTSQVTYNDSLAPLARKSTYFKSLFSTRGAALDMKQYPNLGDLLLNKFKLSLHEQQTLTQKLDKKRFHVSSLRVIANIIASILIPYLYLGWAVLADKISLADMTALVSAFGQLAGCISAISMLLAQYGYHTKFIEYLRTSLEYTPNIEGDYTGEPLKDIDTICFENVSFTYPNSPEPALTGVSFEIKKGERIALVGGNGAGKTTIVKLLMRLYDPQDGRITVNGKDLRKYNISDLRSTTATVFQEFDSYHIPINEFISCTDKEHTDNAKVREVLNRVGLMKKIEVAPHGIFTEYGKFFDKDGLIFSGGEQQKMIIARMLYKDCPLLLLDEPSSSLDPESEYAINQDIMRIAKGKTTIIISHRLSTTRSADKILFFDKGELCEQGSHSELIKQGGAYSHLYGLQASGYAES